MLIEIIKTITLSGWTVQIDENPLGLVARGCRVVDISILKDGRDCGTGIPYIDATDERVGNELLALFEMATSTDKKVQQKV